MSHEKAVLLPTTSSAAGVTINRASTRELRARATSAKRVVLSILLICFTGTLLLRERHPASATHAERLLSENVLMDTHIDLPVILRYAYNLQPSAYNLSDTVIGAVDIPRLRSGKLGAFFWSVFVPCPAEDNANFTMPAYTVRDTLEQIDIVKQSVAQYSSTFRLATSAADIQQSFKSGFIASLMGAEGAHQLGNSLAVLRQYYEVGVRYLTLTHTCNNAFADSAGTQEDPAKPLHHGLSAFGRELVHEMNRLGMLVDVSHTSTATAHQVLDHSLAPPIASHSGAKGVWDVVRNVDDAYLRRLREGDSKSGDGVISVVFAPEFLSEGEDSKGRLGHPASVAEVADHIDYIAKRAGKTHVGIGSDFDGARTPEGLEDVSKYPSLIEQLIERGWSDADLIGLMGGNFLRVFRQTERVRDSLKHMLPITTLYSKRPDLPYHWNATTL
ncbi:uncharacterized protein L969DRAFT_74645 [Mixia osmundae IAM 14324]|uniref:Dipeptidase n=1 Tax=Mixia osmundae (strain CBS 9802 / IAM 14324 / JCM 22182 / KY 12970) TaxID=764103 RepID=G7E0S5_MIXOS|nr:uncharacterized protein L969DRAFT_74645 [Mixia osmundae IAM 14324]KEI39467.1 hypothetical protein L969DRAFT_74645 [Mixia osmundae IAM 14324]GAA96435.1 hypothetical protein E5Q_03102 [Mixia osmundae IAM 14324]